MSHEGPPSFSSLSTCNLLVLVCNGQEIKFSLKYMKLSNRSINQWKKIKSKVNAKREAFLDFVVDDIELADTPYRF